MEITRKTFATLLKDQSALILIGIFGSLGLITAVIISFFIGYSQRPLYNITTEQAIVPVVTRYPGTKSYITPSVTPTVGPTYVYTPQKPVTNVEAFNYHDLLNADNTEALTFITKAFTNMQAINSIGYKYISTDGEENGITYTAKYELDPTNLTYNYSLTDVIDWKFGDWSRYNKAGHRDIMGGGTIEQVRLTVTDAIFEYTWETISHSQFHTGTLLPSDSFSAKPVTLPSGKRAVEYLFSDNREYIGADHYLIWLGEDGLVYLLQVPQGYSYSEYSNFEYNVKYNLNYFAEDYHYFEMTYDR